MLRGKKGVDPAVADAAKGSAKDVHAIVQLNRLPKSGAGDLTRLAGIDLKPVAYLGAVNGLSTTYVASVDSSVKSASPTWNQLVHSLVKLRPADKVDPHFSRGDSLVHFWT